VEKHVVEQLVVFLVLIPSVVGIAVGQQNLSYAVLTQIRRVR